MPDYGQNYQQYQGYAQQNPQYQQNYAQQQPQQYQQTPQPQQMADELTEGMIIHSTPQFEAIGGDYNFFVKSYSFGFFQPKNADSKIPACKTVDYTLLIPYQSQDTGECVFGQTTYSLKLTPKLMGVLAKFFESTGAVPEYAEFAIDFNLPVGRTGVCLIEQRASNSGGLYSSVRDVYRPSQRPRMTMNDGMPYEPQQAQYGA